MSARRWSGRRVAVIVPTTARPVFVCALRRRPQLPASFVCQQGDYRPLELSAGFDRLVGPGGPLASSLADYEPTSIEVVLSEAVETGRSWELPLALACYVSANGALIVKPSDAPDLVLWSTGALDADLNIVPADYHVTQKLAVSAEALADLPAMFFAPRGDDTPTKIGAHPLGVANGLPDVLKALEGNVTDRARQRSGKSFVYWASAAAIAIGGIGTGIWLYPPTGTIPARETIATSAPQQPKKATSHLAIEEIRAPNGARCIDVVLGNVTPQIVFLTQTGSTFQVSDRKELCFLRYTFSEGTSIELDVPGLNPAPIAEQAWRTALNQSLRSVPPTGQPVRYNIHVRTPKGERLMLSHELR